MGKTRRRRRILELHFFYQVFKSYKTQLFKTNKNNQRLKLDIFLDD